MKKINTAPISGMQELLPASQNIFDNLKAKIAEVYHQYGYQAVETPSIERTEILLAKAGGETEKQIYQVAKTGEKSVTSAKEALRFDHTVPLARYVVEHENDLVFPFKVAQVGLNFRGERAQKGRFREFYQCDIDVVGRGELSLAYDADVIITLLEAFKAFGLETPVLARINNRKILSGLLKHLNLTKQAKDVYNIIDHAEKVTPEKTKLDLETIGLTSENVKKILAFMNLCGERSVVIKELNNLEIDNELYVEGVAELDQVLYLLEAAGYAEMIQADMKIVRGLDYYTGTVFEFVLPEHRHLGSVAGGGRYDNLTGFFADRAFPGVGGSIGLTRLFYILREHNLLDAESADTLIDYAIIPVSEREFDESLDAANKLRQKNYSVTIVFNGKRLSDKMTYASKVAKNGIVIGEAEVESKTLRAKDFATGEESEINLEIVSNPEDFWGD